MKGQTSWFNLSVVFALGLGSLTYGYVLSIVATTLGQPNFYIYFNLTVEPTDARYEYTNRIIGAVNGVFSAGGVFGALFMAWMSDASGRKMSLAVATIATFIGSALQAGSVHIGMFLFARFLTGVGAGMLITVVPVFQAEVAPPASRGFLVGQTGAVIVFAYSLAAWIGVACYYSTNPAFQWRFPLAMQCVWPLFMLGVLPIVPESPRWLLFQNRHEEAWKIVAKLHHRANDPDGLFAREEFAQMSQQVKADQAAIKSETVMDLFRKPSYRKRMICAFLMMYAAQSTGNLVIYNYSVILYRGLGQTGAVPLILGAAYCTIAAVFNFVCALLLDRIGRVLLLLIGLAGSALCLCCEAAMVAKYSGTDNVAGLSAGVFFLFFYIVFYGGCVDANTYVYCSEIFPTHIRSRGMAFSIVVLYLCTIPFAQAAPTAFAQIGWKYYIVFIVLTLINIPVVWWYFPETKGLSLEEINEKFGDEVVVHFTNIADTEQPKLDAAIKQDGVGDNKVEATHHEMIPVPDRK